MIETPRIRRKKLFPCETPGCSSSCAYAFSCHNERMGNPSTFFWAGIGLIVFLAIGALL
jgi:hypothetical protein